MSTSISTFISISTSFTLRHKQGKLKNKTSGDDFLYSSIKLKFYFNKIKLKIFI